MKLDLRRAIVSCLAFVVMAPGPSDLDSFMQQVLARRDDNWKKLQQYVLDEQERAEIRGPAEALIWGEKREYTWYLRDGYFIRSPSLRRQPTWCGSATGVMANASTSSTSS